jgi:CheY-like chemotaxis protein
MPNEPILIVDDNLMNLKLEKRLLELEQYQVLTAKNAEETLKTLEYFRPRLILMDFQLPGMDGVELTQRIKADARNKDILILMATSYDQQGDEARARAAGCTGYLNKPIDTQTLPGVIAGYLRGASNDGGQTNNNAGQLRHQDTK